MTDSEKMLNVFSTRVRQLILQFKQVKTENQSLRDAVTQKDGEIAALQAQLVQAQKDYNSLKMARMIEISDGDMEAAKSKVAKLIRDVDKCITLLSEK